MNSRRLYTAIIASGIFVTWGHFAQPAVAQEPAAPKAIPATSVAEPEPVHLSRGSEDVLKLTHAKLSDDVIVAFIKSGERRFNLTASEIVYLRQEGVSDRVLTAIIGPPPPAAAPAQPAVP